MKKPFSWDDLPTYILGVAAVFFLLMFVTPFFSVYRVSEKGRTMACLSNLKQIGLGLAQYAQDNDDEFPNVAHRGDPAHSWRSDVYPYIKAMGIFKCPSHRDERNALDGFPISYAANDSGLWGHAPGYQGDGAFSPAGAKPLKMADYPDPAHLIAICEMSGNNSYDFDADDAAGFNPGGHNLWAGHDGNFDVLFADCHARQMKPQQSAAYVDDAFEIQDRQIALRRVRKAGGKETVKVEPKADHTARNLWYRDSSKPLSINGASILEKCVESR